MPLGTRQHWDMFGEQVSPLSSVQCVYAVNVCWDLLCPHLGCHLTFLGRCVSIPNPETQRAFLRAGLQTGAELAAVEPTEVH